MSDAIRAAAALAARKLSYEGLYSLQYKPIVEYVSGHDVLPFFPPAMEKACATGGSPGVFDHLLEPEEPSIVHNGVSNMAFNDVNATHANRKLHSGRTTSMWPDPLEE